MGYCSMCLVTLWSVDYVMECVGCCRMHLFAPGLATHGVLRGLSPRVLILSVGRCASKVGRFVCPSLLVFNRSTVRSMFMRAFMSRTGVYLTVSWVRVHASV